MNKSHSNIATEGRVAQKVTASTALMSHAKKFVAQRNDAKSILLIDHGGKVEEPTNKTLNLLGVRPSASYRKQLAANKSANAGASDDLNQDILELQQPRKRFRGQDGGAVDPSGATAAYKCTFEGCLKLFTNQQQLKTHLAYHQSKTNFLCSVPSCRKPFNYRHNLQMHMRVHNDHRPFECPQSCGKSFRTKGNMMDHLRRHYAIK